MVCRCIDWSMLVGEKDKRDDGNAEAVEDRIRGSA
jgi:hypothetical protein